MSAPIDPRELKIEITDACNLRCAFCYLGAEPRGGGRFMAEEEVLRWIDWAADNGITGVRFTGGEPTLHPRLKMFCFYAHLRGRRVTLNTNGTGDEELYRELFRVTNDVRISLPTVDALRMDELTGGAGVLAKKRHVLGLALEAGVPLICLLTPLLPELRGSLKKFLHFAEISPRIMWLPLRYESTPAVPRPWTRGDAQAFAEEMAELMDLYPGKARGIFLATPFCSVTPASLGLRVFHGRTQGCGPFTALNVDVLGRLHACFEIGKLDGVRSLPELKASPEVRACVSSDGLPDECRSCAHVSRCAGGCRKPYGLVQHGGGSVDYLAGFL